MLASETKAKQARLAQRAKAKLARDIKDNLARIDAIALHKSSLLTLQQEWEASTDWRRQRTIEYEMRMLNGRIEALENSLFRSLPKEERDKIKRERKAAKFEGVIDESDLPIARGPSAIVQALHTMEGYKRDFLIGFFETVTGHVYIPLQARDAFD